MAKAKQQPLTAEQLDQFETTLDQMEASEPKKAKDVGGEPKGGITDIINSPLGQLLKQLVLEFFREWLKSKREELESNGG